MKIKQSHLSIYRALGLSLVFPLCLMISGCSGGSTANNNNTFNPTPSPTPILTPTPTPTPTPNPTPTPTPVACNPCTIFYAGNNGSGYDGNLLGKAQAMGATGITTGVQGADFICESEAGNSVWHPNLPSGKHWQAFLVDGVNRVACTSANCESGVSGQTDWVLSESKVYISESGVTIGTTNESAIFYPFPLESSFTQGSTVPTHTVNGKTGLYGHMYWTGISTTYISDTNNNCQAWTTPSASGVYGTGDVRSMPADSEYATISRVDNQALSSFVTSPCAPFISLGAGGFAQFQTHGLLCVEQPN